MAAATILMVTMEAADMAAAEVATTMVALADLEEEEAGVTVVAAVTLEAEEVVVLGVAKIKVEILGTKIKEADMEEVKKCFCLLNPYLVHPDQTGI